METDTDASDVLTISDLLRVYVDPGVTSTKYKTNRPDAIENNGQVRTEPAVVSSEKMIYSKVTVGLV